MGLKLRSPGQKRIWGRIDGSSNKLPSNGPYPVGLALDVAEKQDGLVNLLIEVHANGEVEARNSANVAVPRGRS
jgi:hypothetical protein